MKIVALRSIRFTGPFGVLVVLHGPGDVAEVFRTISL